MTRPVGTRPVGPALAFYLAHAHECDVLWELGKVGAKVEDNDWRMFEDVIERAAKQVEPWLEDARERGIAALGTSARVVSRTRTIAKDWYAAAELAVSGTKGGKPQISKLWIGAWLAGYPEGEGSGAFFAPYVAVTGGLSARQNAFDLLARGGLQRATLAPDWFAADSIALGYLPIDATSDLDTLTEQSTRAFEDLARALQKVTS